MVNSRCEQAPQLPVQYPPPPCVGNSCDFSDVSAGACRICRSSTNIAKLRCFQFNRLAGLFRCRAAVGSQLPSCREEQLQNEAKSKHRMQMSKRESASAADGSLARWVFAGGFPGTRRQKCRSTTMAAVDLHHRGVSTLLHV